MSENLEGSIDPISASPEELAEFEAESQKAPVDSNAAPVSKEEKQAVQQMIKELKLKVNGKEIVEKIDLNDEARLIKALQMEKASQEAFQRAAAKEKEIASINTQLDQFFELLRTDPLKVLMNPELGLNAEELANKILDIKIEEELKTPEQKALEEAKAKLAEYEEKEKKSREEAEQLRHEKLSAQYEKEFSDSITNAISKGELPASPYIVAKFGQLMEIALKQKLDVSADDLIPIIKETYIRDMKDMLGKLPDEAVEDLISPDRVKAMRNKRIQAVREANAKAASSPKIEETSRQPSKEDNKPKKKGDFWKQLGQF